jgi:plastocyanin
MKNKFLFSIIGAALLCTVVVVSCSKSGNGSGTSSPTQPVTPPANGSTVSIANFAFVPATLNVTAGSSVTWTNNDATTHTVTADDNSFNSGNVAPGASFTMKFSAAATVAYHCAIHPMMKATVVAK